VVLCKSELFILNYSTLMVPVPAGEDAAHLSSTGATTGGLASWPQGDQEKEGFSIPAQRELLRAMIAVLKKNKTAAPCSWRRPTGCTGT
jgi:hypothetical protein